MKKIGIILCLLCVAMVATARDRAQERAALEVIHRFIAQQDHATNLAVKVVVTGEKKGDKNPSFAYDYKQGKLTIRATDGVSACRAFYDFVKSNEAGISTWNTTRLQFANKLRDTSVFRQSPFAHHQYMNVVTYGYSCPFWDEARWDKEIDWMALHGIDMPLVLIGAEGVYREVFKDMGVSDADLDEWEVGPAHLPWFRMGNLSGNTFDGPLGEEWHSAQERLCKHVLSRMRALGMSPVCPAFGGFVPPAFASKVDKVDTTGWDWMPNECRNYRIHPTSAAFVEVGRRFIQKWESRYGKGKYYISDSFNEMEVPSDFDELTRYGDSVYKSIVSANSDAVWVTQGWTFVWQYNQWGLERFKALTRNIPNNKMLVLYMSPEYDPSRYYGGGGAPCFLNYGGFAGKEWAYTLLPNMGGKNFYTGDLKKYAWEFAQEIKGYSDTAQNLTTYGITAEGIENNEMLYELIADIGWGYASQEVETWMRRYSKCRYDEASPLMSQLEHTLLNTVYGKYIDHPRFGWQNGAVLTAVGTAVLDSEFYKGVEQLFQNAEVLQQHTSQALEYDLAEVVAMYLGGKVDAYGLEINQLLETYANSSDTLQQQQIPDAVEEWICKIDNTLLMLDSVIAIHPQDLALWERQAMNQASSTAMRLRNARNARRIVTIWFGNHKGNEPVQDYASKVWSGLVRDYYRPRVVGAWQNKVARAMGTTEPFSQVTFENAFVNAAPKLSPHPQLPTNKILFLARIVANVSK